jgi:prepilin-type N-terminal cleavage/methylation domain-containing protein
MPQINSKPKSMLADASGFTLLEIIAVIVILSIIAVVAVPRYFDLQDEARNKTVRTGLAEAIGRVNGHFAEALLGGSMPWEVDLRATVLGEDLGDFTLQTSIDAQGGVSKGAVSEKFFIKVIGKDESALRGISAFTNLPRPGM